MSFKIRPKHPKREMRIFDKLKETSQVVIKKYGKLLRGTIVP